MISKPKVAAVSVGERQHWLKLYIGSALFILVLVAAGVAYYEVLTIKNHNADKVANAADQVVLEKSLQASVNNPNDPNGVIYTVGRLISGQKNGTFNIGKSELVSLYLERGSAFIQLKQYANALDSYGLAGQLDNSTSTQVALLPGEIEAKYMLGARKELIPLYQQLISLESKTSGNQANNPYGLGRIAVYQADIQALQNNQEIAF